MIGMGYKIVSVICSSSVAAFKQSATSLLTQERPECGQANKARADTFSFDVHLNVSMCYIYIHIIYIYICVMQCWQLFNFTCAYRLKAWSDNNLYKTRKSNFLLFKRTLRAIFRMVLAAAYSISENNEKLTATIFVNTHANWKRSRFTFCCKIPGFLSYCLIICASFAQEATMRTINKQKHQQETNEHNNFRKPNRGTILEKEELLCRYLAMKKDQTPRNIWK